MYARTFPLLKLLTPTFSVLLDIWQQLQSSEIPSPDSMLRMQLLTSSKTFHILYEKFHKCVKICGKYFNVLFPNCIIEFITVICINDVFNIVFSIFLDTYLGLPSITVCKIGPSDKLCTQCSSCICSIYWWWKN